MLKRFAYETLEPRSSGVVPAVFRLVHHAMVIGGIAAIVLDSVPAIAAAHGPALMAAFYAALAFFILEYVLRLAIAPEAPWAHPGQPWRDRLHGMRSFSGIVDLCSSWLILAATLTATDPALARLTCVIWLFKFVPYSEGLSLLARVVSHARSALLSVFLSFTIVLLCAGTLAYVVEREAQPDTFGSIPNALWWTVVTLTTTGYGDAVPVTVVGRLLASGVMICGIALFALWAGILANGFAAEIRRRDLMHTWDLVTKVPFFREVGTEFIAEVARLLRPREVPPGFTIMRRGEPGDCMYFVVSGEVEIRVRPEPLRLGPGDFFGEIALVTGGPRTATAVATKHCVLLTLHLTDFRHLAARRPHLTEAIGAEAARRMGEGQAKTL